MLFYFIYYFLVVGIGLYLMLSMLAKDTKSFTLEEAIRKKPMSFVTIIIVNLFWPLSAIIMLLLIIIDFIYTLTTLNKDKR